MVSSLVSKLYMKVSVSVSIFGSAWYQYQYQYQNFRPAEYQYRIGIEFVDQESISIVSVSEKVVSKVSVLSSAMFWICIKLLRHPFDPSYTCPYCERSLCLWMVKSSKISLPAAYCKF